MTNHAAKNDNGAGTLDGLRAHWGTIEGRHARPGHYESTALDWASGILAHKGFDIAAARAEAAWQAKFARQCSGKRSPFAEAVCAILAGVGA